MHWISADKIHNGYQFLPSPTYIGVDQGVIVAMTNTLPSGAAAEHYPGTLCPGLVNAHCHIELSHMKGLIPKGTGLRTFLSAVMTQRHDFTDNDKSRIIDHSLKTCYNAGTIAIGDICNTADALDSKLKLPMYFHNFIETMGKVPERAESAMARAIDLLASYQNAAAKVPNRMRQSIVPHAPYSVSDELLQLINQYTAHHTISIHSQEHPEEDRLFLERDGAFMDFLLKIGIPLEAIKIYGTDAVSWLLQHIDASHPLLLVHNTHMDASQILHAESMHGNVFYCVCPRSNLYIEQSIPPIDLLTSHNVRLCIGTDSLASNESLDMLAEMQCIKEYYPDISWEQIIHWSTYNGACALSMDKVLGSIEIGKIASFAIIDAEYQKSELLRFLH